jgi:hypothetical protein
LFLCGCQSRQGGFFPIGLYGMDNPDDYRSVHDAGFNLITATAQKSTLDAATRAGLRVLASPATQAGTNFSAFAARRAVARFDGHPGLWGWYLCDEPDFNDVAPSDLRRANRVLKQAGARKPTLTVVMSGFSSLDYANITDIFMLDRYPVPWQPLCTFPQQLRMARLALGPRKPLIAVIQAFDWRYFQEVLGVSAAFRPPNYEEIRCMTYCAMEARAQGLFYYAHTAGGWRLPDHPDTWSALQRVVRETRERLPLFQAEPLWWPYHHNFVNGEPGWNESLQASVSPSLWKVRRGNPAVPAGRYILAVNNTARTIDYQLRVSEFGLPKAVVLGEGRVLEAAKGWLADQFGPYAVHIYGPF